MDMCLSPLTLPHALTHSLTHSITHSPRQCLAGTHAPIHPPTHPATLSLTHPPSLSLSPGAHPWTSGCRAPPPEVEQKLLGCFSASLLLVAPRPRQPWGYDCYGHRNGRCPCFCHQAGNPGGRPHAGRRPWCWLAGHHIHP